MVKQCVKLFTDACVIVDCYLLQALEIVSLVMDHGKLKARSILERLCPMGTKKGLNTCLKYERLLIL